MLLLLGPCPFISVHTKELESLQSIHPAKREGSPHPGLYPDIPAQISFDVSDMLGDKLYFVDLIPFPVFWRVLISPDSVAFSTNADLGPVDTPWRPGG